MEKIKSISRVMQKICVFFQIALPLFSAALWLYWPIPSPLAISTRFYPQNAFFDIVNPIDNYIRIMGFSISLIPLGIEVLTLYYLFKLCQLFEKGKIFTLKNVQYIRNMGICILSGELIYPFYDAITSLITHQQNPAGHLMFSVNFNSDEIGYIFIGTIILLIARVMREACTMEEERAYTV